MAKFIEFKVYEHGVSYGLDTTLLANTTYITKIPLIKEDQICSCRTIITDGTLLVYATDKVPDLWADAVTDSIIVDTLDASDWLISPLSTTTSDEILLSKSTYLKFVTGTSPVKVRCLI